MTIQEIFTTFLTASIGVLTGSLVSWLISAPKKAQKEKNEVLKRLVIAENGMQALLRNEIQKIYIITKKRGFCYIYEKHNLSYLFKSYKESGGNSYICELYQQIMDLDVVDPEENRKEK